jgi:hypothetical protein
MESVEMWKERLAQRYCEAFDACQALALAKHRYLAVDPIEACIAPHHYSGTEDFKQVEHKLLMEIDLIYSDDLVTPQASQLYHYGASCSVTPAPTNPTAWSPTPPSFNDFKLKDTQRDQALMLTAQKSSQNEGVQASPEQQPEVLQCRVNATDALD